MKKYTVVLEAFLILVLVSIFQYATFLSVGRWFENDDSYNWFNFFNIFINTMSSVIGIITAFWLWKLKFIRDLYIPSKQILGVSALVIILGFLIGDFFNFIPFFDRLMNGKILFYHFDFQEFLLYGPNAFYLVYAIIIGPILEEYFFRGILLRKFNATLSLRSSIIFSSLLFAFVHVSLEGFLYYFLVGCLLAYIFHRSNSLPLVMGCHMLYNFFAIMVPRKEFNTNDNLFPLIALFFFACFAGLYVALKHFHTITSPVEENSSPLDPLEYE